MENRKEQSVCENRWLSSLKELKSPRAVALCGVMGALSMVLGMVTTINLGPYVKITLSGLPDRIMGCVLGPAAGGVFSAAMEVIRFMLRPDGVYFPGFTLSAAAGGVITGLFLYRRPITLKRIFLMQVLLKVVINMGLNSLWLNILYGKAFWALLPARAMANGLRLPADTLLCFAVLKLVEKTVMPMTKGRRA